MSGKATKKKLAPVRANGQHTLIARRGDEWFRATIAYEGGRARTIDKLDPVDPDETKKAA